MGYSRRVLVQSIVSSAFAAQLPPDQADEEHSPPRVERPDEDRKLPNGKSQKDAIAEHDHAEALKDAAHLVDLSNQIRDELNKAGNFVVSVSTIHKTEEIEKLARKIRGRLKS